MLEKLRYLVLNTPSSSSSFSLEKKGLGHIDIVKKLKQWSQSAGNALFSSFHWIVKKEQIKSGTSETTRNNTEYIKNISIHVPKHLKPLNDEQLGHYLAGLIDGDGCFLVSKKGYASLEIVMETRDKHCLYQIKQRFGGSVKLRSGVNWLRYRMHHRKGMLDLINAVNGEIRNPTRLLQLKKICDLYNIPIISPAPLTYGNGWFSGFFDSDGSVYFNIQSSQIFITAAQKNRFILDPLPSLYGGSIYIQKESFKWVVYKKSEIVSLLNYFKICPSRSAKFNRILMIKRYYELKELKAQLQSSESILGKAWNKFLLKWEKFEK